MKRMGWILLVALALSASAAHAAVTFEYILSGGFPLSTTPDGQSVAGNTTSYGPFRWTSAGGLVPLGMDPTPSPGGTPGISADGTKVTSTIISGDGTYSVAGLWTQGSGWTVLPLPPDGVVRDASSTTAYALSGDGGTVVGLYWRAVGRGHAFRWNAASGSVDLGSRNAGYASRANAVNGDGSVIGGWDEAVSGRWRAAAWVNGVETVLSDTSGDGIVMGCNPAGTIVVGYDRNPATDTREVARWIRTGSTWSAAQRLGTVPGSYPTYSVNQARGVTASGDMIVGYCSFDGSPFWSTGFVWTAETGTIDVVNWLALKGVSVNPSFYIQDLTAISPDGQWIFGYGQDVVSPYTRRGFRIRNTDVTGAPATLPRAGLALAAPSPNPSSGTARLQFSLPAGGDAEVSVFDAAGRRVATPFRGFAERGTRTILWDGRGDDGAAVPGGLYFVRLTCAGSSVARRLVRCL